MSGASGLFRRAAELCAELRELAPAERELRLDAACAGDAELLALARTLLAGERAPLTGLDRPAIEHVRVPELALPERIGRCRIVRVIGRGGQGIVYEAEQDVPRRPVAVKVIGASWVSASSRRRFEEEVEILGRLEHPGIARIYEGGVAPGPFGDQPYFVMQLGLGKPLTEHANEHGLDLAARVRLLTRICEAVEHAHGKLVVHCDLKPANILVTAERGGDDPHVGRPLILDFGIAQVLGRAEVELAAGKGTPGFMAPEQEAGERPDVRWDVFALGKIGGLLVSGARARRDRRTGTSSTRSSARRPSTTPAGDIARSRSSERTSSAACASSPGGRPDEPGAPTGALRAPPPQSGCAARARARRRELRGLARFARTTGRDSRDRGARAEGESRQVPRRGDEADRSRGRARTGVHAQGGARTL